MIPFLNAVLLGVSWMMALAVVAPDEKSDANARALMAFGSMVFFIIGMAVTDG